MNIEAIIYFLEIYGICPKEDLIDIKYDEDNDYIITYKDAESLNITTTIIFQDEIKEYYELKEYLINEGYNSIKFINE